MGDLELYAIYAQGGAWEASWSPLQGTPLGDLLPVVSKAVYDHALAGWTLPFVRALGLPPEGALRKLLPADKVCAERAGCTLKTISCQPLHKRMPWCFVPSGLDVPARPLGAEAIRLWREGVRLLVVDETP
jgi:hypothetical protein